jgi:hypothetical protein
MSTPPVLTITADRDFLPVVVSFVENTCSGYRFGKRETSTLMLAAEEIFVYLSQHDEGTLITLACRPKPYLMELTLEFNARTFNLRAFNLTSSVNVEDESSLDEMGLLLASRMVDRFSMNQTGSSIHMSLLKYRNYHEKGQTNYHPRPLDHPIITRPDPLEARILAGLIHESESNLPFYFETPYMVADMLEAKDLDALILKDSQNTIGGGLFWKRLNQNTIEIMGPFVYGQDDSCEMGTKLVEKCLEEVGKENATGIICRHYGEMIPEHYFEVIGTFSGKKVFFRQMKEDTGSGAWIHPLIEEEIRDQYDKLFLPRNILAFSHDQEPSSPYSVISSEMNRSSDRVVMFPLIFGRDALENLGAHLSLFKSEGYKDISFQLDLGQSDQADWVPSLIQHSFTPELLLPHGGKGDLLIMTYKNHDKVGI